MRHVKMSTNAAVSLRSTLTAPATELQQSGLAASGVPLLLCVFLPPTYISASPIPSTAITQTQQHNSTHLMCSNAVKQQHLALVVLVSGILHLLLPTVTHSSSSGFTPSPPPSPLPTNPAPLCCPPPSERDPPPPPPRECECERVPSPSS